jgi:hypothetical protein
MGASVVRAAATVKIVAAAVFDAARAGGLR